MLLPAIQLVAACRKKVTLVTGFNFRSVVAGQRFNHIIQPGRIAQGQNVP